jgi:hypothetical protein
MSRLHISKFIDRVQHFEQRGARDFTCPLADAKNLHADITRLLLELEELRNGNNQDQQRITVEMQGGSF